MPKESQDVLLFLVAVFTEIPKMLGAHGTIPNFIGATSPLWAVSPFFPFTSCWDSCLPCWISKQNSTQKYHWWLTSIAQASQSLSNQLYLWTASNRPFFFLWVEINLKTDSTFSLIEHNVHNYILCCHAKMFNLSFNIDI